MTEDLLDAAFRVAKMVQPCRLQRAPPSIVPEERPTTFSLFTRRGEKNVAPLTKESEKTTQEYFADVYRYVHDRAREHADPVVHPLFPFIFSEAVGQDCITERVHKMKPKEQLCSTYDMGDLSLNLTPRPSCLVEQYGDKASANLRRLLDEPCEGGEGCYYRHYYPQVGSPGHVALPAGISNLLVNVLSCSSFEGAYSLLRSLENLLELYIRTEKRFRVCIVCLLIDQSTNQFSAQGGGGGGNVLSFSQKVDRNTFLLNTEAANDLGFRKIDAPDYLNPIVNVHEGQCVELWDLRLRENYSLDLFDDDVWICTRNKK